MLILSCGSGTSPHCSCRDTQGTRYISNEMYRIARSCGCHIFPQPRCEVEGVAHQDGGVRLTHDRRTAPVLFMKSHIMGPFTDKASTLLASLSISPHFSYRSAAFRIQQRTSHSYIFPLPYPFQDRSPVSFFTRHVIHGPLHRPMESLPNP